MANHRVPMASALDAFSVPATVTVPGGDAVETRGIWVSPLTEEMPVGRELQRRDPRRILALPRADVPQPPKGTTIVCVEDGGDDDDLRTWRVDGIDRMEGDCVRVIVVAVGV
jgi:hypothetical protein